MHPAPPRARAGRSLRAWRRAGRIPVLLAAAALVGAAPGLPEGPGGPLEAGIRPLAAPLQHGLRSTAGLGVEEITREQGPTRVGGPVDRSPLQDAVARPRPLLRGAPARRDPVPRRRLRAGFVADRSTAPPRSR